MRIGVSVIALAIGMAVAGGVGIAGSAADLNSKGFDAYKAKKWDEAIEDFKAALEAEPDHALANYNLACTLSLMRKAGRTCEFDAYRSAITDHLQAAIAADPKRLERVKKDPDLEAIHDTLWFQKAANGLDPESHASWAALLPAVSWFCSEPGCAGSIRFSKDGTVVLDDASMDPDEGKTVHKAVHGRWKIVNGAIVIRFATKVDDESEWSGAIEDGLLQIGDRKFSDQPDECSA